MRVDFIFTQLLTYFIFTEAHKMRSIRYTIFMVTIAVFSVVYFGCSGGSDPLLPGEVPDGTKVLVANSLGETISQINYAAGGKIVQNDIAQTGQAPNQFLVNGNTGYVLNSMSNSVLSFEIDTMTVNFEASVGAGKSPFNMAFINNYELLVTNFIANDCVRLNVHPSFTGDRVIATIPLPIGAELPKDTGVDSTNGSPEAVVIDANTAYVTMANLDAMTYTAGGPGLVALIDLPSNQVLSTIETLGRNTVGLCHDPYSPDKMYIISAGDMDPATWAWEGNGKIDVFNLSSKGITASIDIPAAPFEMIVAPTGIAYITDGMEGKLLTMDTATHALGPDIELVETPGDYSFASGLAMGPNFLLYALEFNNDDLIVIDTSQGNVIVDRFKMGDGPDAVVVIW